ncbi:filamentous hemagglutinin N-terminal domain-containing protein [Providencia rettgeri]
MKKFIINLTIILPILIFSKMSFSSILSEKKVLIDNSKNQQIRIAENRNNIPIIEVNPSDKNQVSHNYYQEFHVNKKGLKINNHPIYPAKLIISEVTSNNKSYIYGNININTEKTHHLIVNPNGINCNRCSFDNLTTLTAFSVQHINNQGEYKPNTVQKGTINISKLKNNYNDLNLIANKIRFNKENHSEGSIKIYNGDVKITKDEIIIPDIFPEAIPQQRKRKNILIRPAATVNTPYLFIHSENEFNIANNGIINTKRAEISTLGEFQGKVFSAINITRPDDKKTSSISMNNISLKNTLLLVDSSSLLLMAPNLTNDDIQYNNTLLLRNGAKINIGQGFGFNK